tara:strand:- start:1061 stop:1231 length:171 start_codon:yes stop_codon:yes gene_type:complete
MTTILALKIVALALVTPWCITHTMFCFKEQRISQIQNDLDVVHNGSLKPYNWELEK